MGGRCLNLLEGDTMQQVITCFLWRTPGRAVSFPPNGKLNSPPFLPGATSRTILQKLLGNRFRNYITEVKEVQVKMVLVDPFCCGGVFPNANHKRFVGLTPWPHNLLGCPLTGKRGYISHWGFSAKLCLIFLSVLDISGIVFLCYSTVVGILWH